MKALRTITLVVSAVGVLGGCERAPATTETTVTSAPAAPSDRFGPPEPAPPPRRGMVFIPGGALVAGAPPDSLPRVADEEMPGEQVILKGFYIDVFPYPNEEGAIPLTNVTRDESARLCTEQGKRLCSELEWERACKGPDNLTYEYGDRYDPKRCATGTLPKLLPSGLNVGCQSAFGVRDLHGGVWEWTASPWGRGGASDAVAVRGGNATAGELVGRCANGSARPPGQSSGVVGFRCCAGPPNTAEVTLTVHRGAKLEARDHVDRKLAVAVAPELARLAGKDLTRPAEFVFDRMWIWRPVGNEELVVLGGCSGLGRQPECGIVVARVGLDRVKPLTFASSGYWVPQVYVDRDPRDLWLFGGDDLGSFRRLVGYVWGRISVGLHERRIPRPKKGKKR